MVSHHHHKAFIGITAVIILFAGLYLGAALAANLGTADMSIINVGLSLTTVILLLITGGIVIETRDMVMGTMPKKRRKK